MPDTPPLRLGTRGSQLALCQANMVAAALAATSGRECHIVVIKTSGDRLQDRQLSEVGGKSLFVKELEDALLTRQIDLAVHSSKDLPAALPDGLSIAGVLPREDPHDAVVLPAAGERGAIRTLEELVAVLGQTPSIGTGSIRRAAQLTRVLPGAVFEPVRGNLDTRLRKLDAGEHDALVLAVAGLRRLGFGSRVGFTLPTAACLPAPGQGIVAVETRTDDSRLRGAVAAFSDLDAAAALTAERALVQGLDGGCQTPVGALAATDDDGTIELRAVVVAIDGSRVVRTVVSGSRADAAGVGRRAAERLIADGAGEILQEARRSRRPGEAAQP